MPPKNDNLNIDNLGEYKSRLGDNYKSTKIPKKPTIKSLCDEGDQLLKEESEKLATQSPIHKSAKKDIINTASINPYIKARIKVMGEYPKWKATEILEMEKSGNINNSKYMDFVKLVSQAGDVISNLDN